MGREQLPRGLLLRLGILSAAALLCIHVYLETHWLGTPAAQMSAGPTRSGRDKWVSAGPDGGVKSRGAYIQMLKRNGPARKRNGDREEPPTPCCPPRRPRRKIPRWHINLEPWASESPSLEDEAKRFLSYITTPQVSCTSLAVEGAAQHGHKDAWAACLDPEYGLSRRIQRKRCRVYSFGLGMDDRLLERSLASAGCEVHCFDPGLKRLHTHQAEMWLHRLSVDWRDPNPGLGAQRQHSNTRKLATILNDFGHRQVDVLKADMESAEWKILENLLLEGVLDAVGQLLLELHLHWAGFEVAGDDPSVVRYWFSLLKELERANFRLFHVRSDPARPHIFLHRSTFNVSSSYTLSWVNTDWKV